MTAYGPFAPEDGTEDDEHELQVTRLGRIQGHAVWEGTFRDGPLEGQRVRVAPSRTMAILASTIVDPAGGFIIACPLGQVVHQEVEAA